MLEEKSGVRMDRQYFLQLIIAYAGLLLHEFPRVLSPVIQVVPERMPLLLNVGIRVLLHGVAHKAEGHILRKLDVADRINEAIPEAPPVLVRLREHMHHVVSDYDEIERLVPAEVNYFLETGHGALVLAEIIRELIPNKNDRL